jgi:hypothetical protein
MRTKRISRTLLAPAVQALSAAQDTNEYLVPDHAARTGQGRCSFQGWGKEFVPGPVPGPFDCTLHTGSERFLSRGRSRGFACAHRERLGRMCVCEQHRSVSRMWCAQVGITQCCLAFSLTRRSSGTRRNSRFESSREFVHHRAVARHLRRAP